MFSKGQIIFAILFFIVFVVAITFAYRKDKSKNAAYFKGSYKVLLFAVFVFIALFAFVKLKSRLHF